MPELPEVETVVRGLRPLLVGATITGMWYDWIKTIHSPDADEFAARISGQRISALARRAKYILIHLESDTLMVHLKMTGRLYVAAADESQAADRWVHVKFSLADGRELRFSDSRKFGRVYLTAEPESIIGRIGPEPLEDAFTEDIFRARLSGRNRQIKTLLLDQSFIAGVGNIYADEALHRAGIHPLRKADQLTEGQISALYQTVRAALNDGIDHEGASINWYRKADGSKGSSQDHFYVYGRDGQACHNCGHPIEKIWVGQRGTHFCPSCQSLRED